MIAYYVSDKEIAAAELRNYASLFAGLYDSWHLYET